MTSPSWRPASRSPISQSGVRTVLKTFYCLDTRLKRCDVGSTLQVETDQVHWFILNNKTNYFIRSNRICLFLKTHLSSPVSQSGELKHVSTGFDCNDIFRFTMFLLISKCDRQLQKPATNVKVIPKPDLQVGRAGSKHDLRTDAEPGQSGAWEILLFWENIFIFYINLLCSFDFKYFLLSIYCWFLN